jgi:hypothetical protein
MRTFVLRLIVASLLLSVAHGARGQQPLAPEQAKEQNGTLWYDARQLRVEGQGWQDTKGPYDRLPARAEKTVREAVWSLSRHSAGICIHFATDARALQARWTLSSSRLEMPHMAATGVSGLDLYVRTEDGRWRWLATGQPREQTNAVTLVQGLPEGEREYLLYLPLYNGVTNVELGVPKGAVLRPAAPRPADRRKPLVFYGTSITQGGCASRPGMVHTAILGRWLDRPVINLGFSGNGRMEAEVAQLMAELDAAVYVIDCLPNIGADEVRARTEPLVKILRDAHPTTPILLVEDRNYTDAYLLPNKQARNATSQAALKEVFQRLKAQGDDRLFYLAGDQLLGDDSEGTVDSSHPTDLGFMRQAEAFQKALQPLLP